MEWYIFTPFFLVGMIFGSFFNVVIYRLPLHQSLVTPRSHCPGCKEQIPFYRNIPVISYLLQRGKCANCGEPISFQYPLVEILAGLVWGWSFSQSSTGEALFLAALGSVLLIIAWIDSRHLSIPVSLLLIATLIVSTAIIFGLLNLRPAIFGMLMGIGLPAFIVGAMYLTSGKQGMGFGDILLGAILGLWLGPLQMGIALMLASIMVILFWAATSMKNGWNKDRQIPFAPFLICSAIIAFVLQYYRFEFTN